MQLIIAGKAHPLDKEGKRLVREWSDYLRRPEVRGHRIFLEDYGIEFTAELIQGVDLWLNTPRRPLGSKRYRRHEGAVLFDSRLNRSRAGHGGPDLVVPSCREENTSGK